MWTFFYGTWALLYVIVLWTTHHLPFTCVVHLTCHPLVRYPSLAFHVCGTSHLPVICMVYLHRPSTCVVGPSLSFNLLLQPLSLAFHLLVLPPSAPLQPCGAHQSPSQPCGAHQSPSQPCGAHPSSSQPCGAHPSPSQPCGAHPSPSQPCGAHPSPSQSCGAHPSHEQRLRPGRHGISPLHNRWFNFSFKQKKHLEIVK